MMAPTEPCRVEESTGASAVFNHARQAQRAVKRAGGVGATEQIHTERGNVQESRLKENASMQGFHLLCNVGEGT